MKAHQNISRTPTLPLCAVDPATFTARAPAAPVRVRMTVTPQQAEEWLVKNTNNRKLRDGMAMRYAEDMQAGRWQYNGDVIRFDVAGNLIDGQHRLTGCVLAKTGFDTDVIFGLTTTLCDIGGVRTASDMANLGGMKNSVRAVALAKLVLIHRNHSISRVNNPMLHPSKTAVLQEAIENQEQIQAALVFLPRSLAAASVIDFCNYQFRQYDPERAAQFMHDVLVGESIAADSAAFLLRQRLIANKSAKAKLGSLYMIALFFVAWKYYREGKALKCLKWTEGQEFPTL